MRSDAGRSQPPPSRSGAGAAPLLAALAVFLGVLCALAAHSAIVEQGAFSEYLTQARRCAELGDCPSRGGRTGALPIFHGALWIRLLVHSLQPGHDQTWVQSIILATWLLSIPTTFLLVHRYAGLRAAALAVGLYFPVILVGTDIAMFTYTNLLPLPFAVYYLALAACAESRRAGFGVIGSVALALAVSAELASIVMLPFHVFFVALLARRPLAAVVLSGLAFAVTFGLESTDAALEILRQIPTWRFAVAAAVSGGAMLLAARASRRVLDAASSASERVRIVMTAALIYSAIVMWIVCVLLMRNAPGPRYFLPAAFPFLYLVAERMGALGTRATLAIAGLAALSLGMLISPAATLARLVLQVPVFLLTSAYAIAELVRLVRRRRPPERAVWPAVTVCGFALLLAGADRVIAARRGDDQRLTMRDAERLVPALYAAGFTYPELLASLQGPAADDLMALLTERDPAAFSPSPRPLAAPAGSLLVIKVPADAVGRTQGVIAALPVDHGRSAIVVRDETSFLDWTRLRRCDWRGRGDGARSDGCEEPRRDQPLPHNWPYVHFGPVPPGAAGASAERTVAGAVRYEVPIRTPGHGVAHVIRTGNEWPARWQIVAVEGVPFEGALPAKEVRLPDREPASGRLILELASPIGGDLPWVWRPHVVEVSEANARLLDELRTGE